MKKLICGLLVLCTVFAFAACATQECSYCREEKRCEKVEYYGETLWVCEDCEDAIDDLGDMLEDLEK